MTDAELRIVEFLMTSDATRPADLPDWLLALLEGDRQEELSHELITAASFRTPAACGRGSDSTPPGP
jgi:hypothetical protein